MLRSSHALFVVPFAGIETLACLNTIGGAHAPEAVHRLCTSAISDTVPDAPPVDASVTWTYQG